MPSPRKRPASPNAEILTALGRIEALLTRIADRLDHVSISSGGLSSNAPEDASRQLERARSRSDQPGLGEQEFTKDAAAAAAKAVASAAARFVAPASQPVRQPARPAADRAKAAARPTARPGQAARDPVR
jgi:hypothetical protein